MSSQLYRARADLTAKQPSTGSGMDVRVLYLCGHKGLNLGSKWRGNLPMRCAACLTLGAK